MEKKIINRRDFLRLTAMAGVGSFIIPDAVASTLRQAASVPATTDIPVRTLGKTGLKIPMLSMGVMRADNPNVVRAAYNSGIFLFDTANGYQNGRNEEMLGTFFADKPRESFIIATKAGFNYPFRDDFEADFNDKLETSLKRLKMDHVDIFYAHAAANVEAVRDPRMIAALKKVKDSGKARFIGFSTHAQNPEQIHAAIDTGVYDVILMNYNFKLGNMKETDEAIDRAVKAGIGIVAMKTMTGGAADASGQNKIDAQACLKWVWQNKNITTAIPGFTNFDELDACLTAARNNTLTPAEQQYLAELRQTEMLYCTNCGQCKSQCPNNLPIPDIMRAYMYTYGYKQSSLSKETLLAANLAGDACEGCGECKVKCSSGFDVARKIAAIKPVMDVPYEFLT